MSKTNDHSQRGHHPQGPSQLKALSQCPGFENTPGTSAASERGTRIHEALEVRDPSGLYDEFEMELYEKCVKAEDKLVADFFGDEEYERHNELSTDIPLNAGLEISGTGDVLCVSKSRTKGLMIDYKTGQMKVDDAERNLQAKAYKNGAYNLFPEMEVLRFIFLAPQIDLINWFDFVPETVPFDRQEITPIVGNAKRVREKWKLGTIEESDVSPCEQCTWCRHQTYCPGVHGVISRVGDAAGFHVPADLSGETDDPEILAQRYTVAKLLEPLVEKFKVDAVAAAQEGEVLPGWELRSMGCKKLAVDNEQFYEYAVAHGIQLKDLLDHVNIPVAAIRDLLKNRAPRGTKGKVAKAFEQDGLDAGVIKKGKERFTLRPEQTD